MDSMSYTVIKSGEISVLIGALAGIVLSVIATLAPLSTFGIVDLVVFLAIPVLSGALVSFSNSGGSPANGAIVGLISGLAYLAATVARLSLPVQSDFVVFLLLIVPSWGFLAILGSMFAQRAYISTLRTPPALRICSSCKSPNPPDASFCKNCGTKLG